MLAYLALHLGRAGYETNVYSDGEPGFNHGSLWRPVTAFDPTEEADAIIVSRGPYVFDTEMHAPVRALWCHDHSYPGLMTEERAERMTHVICLSEWQKARFERLYPYLEGKCHVIRNGIILEDEDRFPKAECEQGFDARKPRVVYASSADRGLDAMLQAWPLIRKNAPEAELHVYYGFDTLDRVARANPALASFKAALMAKIAELGGEEGGIFLRGRMGQIDLYREMREARVWGYPTEFLETSCIAAMEARANGLACITSDLAALKETVGEHGYLIPWGKDEDERYNALDAYQEDFAAQVALALTNEEIWREHHTRARKGVGSLDFKSMRLPEWEALVGALVPA